MSEWASKRCRIKTEMSRKAQSIRIHPNRTANLTTESTIEETFYQTRINEAIREGRNYLRGDVNRE